MDAWMAEYDRPVEAMSVYSGKVVKTKWSGCRVVVREASSMDRFVSPVVGIVLTGAF